MGQVATPPESDERLAGLTFATADAPHPEGTGDDRRLVSGSAWRRRDSWYSVVLVICVGLVWLYFRG